MLRTTRWLPLLLLAGAAACADGTSRWPLEPTQELRPNLAARSSGCYTPKFHVMLTPGSATFEGLVTGDLEGTVSLEFDFGSAKFSGVTVANSGTAHWTITGGMIPGPVAFDTEFENRNIDIDRPGSPSTLFENTGEHRARGGVERANLTYKGTFTTVPSLQADHDYHGVICP
jgi:hypothetical protein